MELCHISHKTDITHLLVSMYISIFSKTAVPQLTKNPVSRRENTVPNGKTNNNSRF